MYVGLAVGGACALFVAYKIMGEKKATVSKAIEKEEVCEENDKVEKDSVLSEECVGEMEREIAGLPERSEIEGGKALEFNYWFSVFKVIQGHAVNETRKVWENSKEGRRALLKTDSKEYREILMKNYHLVL